MNSEPILLLYQTGSLKLKLMKPNIDSTIFVDYAYI